jgi:uracil-DNA glycosylase
MEIIFDNNYYDWKFLNLVEFLNYHTPAGWYDFFQQEHIQEQILKISNFLKYEASNNVTIYPKINNVFRSLYCIDVSSIKLVIIGQDPYHNGPATGLAFDVPSFYSTSPSLRNILKEVVDCGYTGHRDLSNWVTQGVLLLNTALTVRESCPGSHTEIWEDFTINLIEYIVKSQNKLVWLLMGSFAQQFKQYIPKSHIYICTTHPSPLSALRSTKSTPAFIGSKCFKSINDSLIKLNHDPIDF